MKEERIKGREGRRRSWTENGWFLSRCSDRSPLNSSVVSICYMPTLYMFTDIICLVALGCSGVWVGGFVMPCVLSEPPRVWCSSNSREGENTGAAVIHLPTRRLRTWHPEGSSLASSVNIWLLVLKTFKIYLFMHMRCELFKSVCTLGPFLKISIKIEPCYLVTQNTQRWI